MRNVRVFAVVCVLLLSVAGLIAQQNESAETSKPAEKTTEKAGKLPAEGEKPAATKEEPPVVTHHEIHVGGQVLHYTATTGYMPIRNEEGNEIEANIFFVAYTLDNPAPKRPLMFSFNGGPGSASIWLHLGAIGPRRVKMLPDGGMPQPPFELIDNEDTWLDQTDLVFIDPVGTGYSRATKKDLAKKFFGVKGDISSVAEFIRLYLSRYQRWTSPLFLVGESYGTTRAAGLSGYLIDRGIALNGVVLVSSVLNFQTLEFTRGNDLPYVLYLPSYTSSAWYHKKLPPDLQQKDLASVLAESEQFAAGAYANALEKGDSLSPQERQSLVDQVARYTGLDRSVVDLNDLRLKQGVFCRELLKGQRLMIGRLDSRFTGDELSQVRGEGQFWDPSMAVIRPPFTATFNNYVRGDLGFKSDLEYYVLGGGVGEWDWGSAGEGFPDTSEALRLAFVKNPYMKLFVASGYFDLATPFFATRYTLDHMNLTLQQHQKITLGYYDAGHMMYIKSDALGRLKKDVGGFLANALQ
ncbi:MAG TPA: peptidase S10 [Candidatus Eisenbacteria bacterium]|nr:peptidase S10 [Candidatus Eisenbacteria bacterium]